MKSSIAGNGLQLEQLAEGGHSAVILTRQRAAVVLSAVALSATVAGARILPSAYPIRRAAAMARTGSDVLIVPSRASFLADDQLGYVQSADFQYLTGLHELAGAVLVL